VQQARRAARHEAVSVEKSFLEPQAPKAALEIARPVADDAVAQHEILRARRRPDRIGLHKTEPRDRARERRRCKQRRRQGVPPQPRGRQPRFHRGARFGTVSRCAR